MVAPQSPARLAVRRFLQRRVAVAGLVVILVFVGVAVFAPLIAPYDPDRDQLDGDPQGAVRGCTGWAPTRTAATCCRA